VPGYWPRVAGWQADVAAVAAHRAGPQLLLGGKPFVQPFAGRGRADSGVVASEIMLTGRDVDAAEAARIGLVSQVTADDQLLDTCYAIAARRPKRPVTRWVTALLLFAIITVILFAYSSG
jgi:enoyl-CoA hydratase/carnithine racemase